MIHFFPEKPIHNLEQIIVDQSGKTLYGEIAIYNMIFHSQIGQEKDFFIWHDLNFPIHSRSFNPYQKTECQIDFLIVCEDGILVVEVKGGSISWKNNTFYYGKYDEPLKQEPFKQAQGYKYTLKGEILSNWSNVYFERAVAFPHSSFRKDVKIIDKSIVWTIDMEDLPKFQDKNNKPDFLRFAVEVLNTGKKKHAVFGRKFESLSPKDMGDIKRILSPTSFSVCPTDLDTRKWLSIENLDILSGLSKNTHLIIEGGPGTGKTTFARAFCDKYRYKKGLYLCWNKLLAAWVKASLQERGIKNIEVFTLTSFLSKIGSDFGMPVEFNKLDENEYSLTIKNLFEHARKRGWQDEYDYVIFDEAQDYLDRGIDNLISALFNSSFPSTDLGKAIILLDIDQSYDQEGRATRDYLDILIDYYPHYYLDTYHRSEQSEPIQDLSKLITSNELSNFNILEHCEKSKVIRLKDISQLFKYIKNDILTVSIQNKLNSMSARNSILLIESSIFNYSSRTGFAGLNVLLTDMSGVVELKSSNINDMSNVLKYTSILRYKGLEKSNVFLIIREPSSSNQYELFVGVTRAMKNVEVLIIDELI